MNPNIQLVTYNGKPTFRKKRQKRPRKKSTVVPAQKTTKLSYSLKLGKKKPPPNYNPDYQHEPRKDEPF